ncbi:uncharacterized protein RHO25_013155 [Cercospora beticola]|uniref:Uncharacterized protein n=1 Tax=Cercospora beticola TaxID=122368 RepID=A0ABZ0P9E3_CERBT|nr:hypothetical protein RHO25_013155 [Cercospora beticola]
MAASTLNGTARSLGRLRDKIAIVTGGSSGIGRAIALAYAAEGARIVVADRDVQSKAISEIEVSTADIVRREHGQEVLFHQTDVSSSQSVDGLMSRTVEKYGRLDILVNAAGVAPEIHNPQPIWSLPEATWNMTMGVNATGILNTCRAATAQMMSQPARADGDRGWIVNISSIYGQTAVPGNGED